MPTRAAIYVRTDVLQRNYRRVAALAREKGGRQVRLFAVVKANAYGHDARLAVPAFLAAGCLDFAVATPEEGFAVRETAPRANILVLGYSPPAIAAEMAARMLPDPRNIAPNTTGASIRSVENRILLFAMLKRFIIYLSFTEVNIDLN